MTTLLEKAKSATTANKVRRKGLLRTDEGLDLVIAYIKGDVSCKQFCTAIERSHRQQIAGICTAVLRWAIQEGKIEIIKK